MDKGYEIGTLIGTIDPQRLSTTQLYTDVVDMSDFDEVTFYFLIGNADFAEVTARVVTCNSAGNTVAAFKTATALDESLSANDNTQIIINISADDLAGGVSPADRYVKGGIVCTSNEVDAVACAVIGYRPKHGPGHADVPDLTSVKEIEDDLD